MQTWGALLGREDHIEAIEVAQGLYVSQCHGMKSMSYLARAVAPGTFQVPATYMEFMYKEHYNARSHPDNALVIKP